MKARIAPQRKLSNKEKQAINEYITKQKNEELMRFLKLINVILNRDFGFGKQRLQKFDSALINEMERHQGDPALWVTVDRILIDELKLDFPYENYEEREKAMEEMK